MLKYLFRNNKGTAYVGLLVAVLIIAIIGIGSFYFAKNNANDADDLAGDNIVETLNKAKEDVNNINKNIEDRNEVIKNAEFNDTEGQEFIGNDMIKVFGIKEGDTISSPVKIEGEGIAFENTLIVELRNNNHEALVKEFVTTKAPDAGQSGPFAITLNFEFSNTKEGYIAVYEESAKDGSERNLVEVGVKFGEDIEE